MGGDVEGDDDDDDDNEHHDDGDDNDDGGDANDDDDDDGDDDYDHENDGDGFVSQRRSLLVAMLSSQADPLTFRNLDFAAAGSRF